MRYNYNIHNQQSISENYTTHYPLQNKLQIQRVNHIQLQRKDLGLQQLGENNYVYEDKARYSQPLRFNNPFQYTKTHYLSFHPDLSKRIKSNQCDKSIKQKYSIKNSSKIYPINIKNKQLQNTKQQKQLINDYENYLAKKYSKATTIKDDQTSFDEKKQFNDVNIIQKLSFRQVHHINNYDKKMYEDINLTILNDNTIDSFSSIYQKLKQRRSKFYYKKNNQSNNQTSKQLQRKSTFIKGSFQPFISQYDSNCDQLQNMVNIDNLQENFNNKQNQVHERKLGQKKQGKQSHIFKQNNKIVKDNVILQNSYDESNRKKNQPLYNFIQKIKNRLNVSSIAYKDSKFNNSKFETGHLLMTYQNQLKIRNEIKQKICKDKKIMKKYGFNI